MRCGVGGMVAVNGGHGVWCPVGGGCTISCGPGEAAIASALVCGGGVVGMNGADSGGFDVLHARW